MKEFTVKGNEYTHMRLDAFTQLLASRKTAPIFVSMAKERGSFEILNEVPQEDLDAVLRAIMPFVRRKDGGTWTKVYNGGAFSYDDIGGGEMLQIMFEVLMDYIPDFFTAVGHLV